MEQFRIIMAVVLSVLVFLVWDFLFIPDSAPPPQQTRETNAPPTPTGETLSPKAAAVSPPIPAVTQARDLPDTSPAPEIVVETGLFSVELSGPGACFTRFDLKKYQETKDEGSPGKRLVSEKNRRGTACVDFMINGAAGDNRPVSYFTDQPTGTIDATGSARTLSFFGQVSPGVEIEKRYTFYPDTYAVDLAVMIKNNTDAPVSGVLDVALNRYFSGEASRFLFEGPCAFKDGRLEEVKLNDIKDTPSVTGRLPWIAIQSRYFMSAVVAEQGEQATMALDYGDDGIVTASYRPALTPVLPRTVSTSNFKVYLGPKDLGILKAVGHNLDRAVDFGWFDFIARPCLWLMNQIYRVIPNYGVAIILITLIIKLLFWPLGTKSYKSMGEMKRIQPLMAEIREKYKDDKRKMNEEMMGLYKTYKVNPLGGCLPMLVQIPVFIAFYRMLYQAMALRHAPFLLWINDLSAPERLFSFDITLPLMQPPTGIPVLTIIMGATMFLQQKMQPAPGDPAQAKIMMLMPIFLTVIFINFPSGLVLYFIVNNLFSIFQQQYVTRKNS